MPFGILSQVDQKNHVLDEGSGPPWEGAILRERHATTSDDAAPLWAVKNGWTDRAVWVMDLDGLKEACIRWESRSSEQRGNF